MQRMVEREVEGSRYFDNGGEKNLAIVVSMK